MSGHQLAYTERDNCFVFHILTLKNIISWQMRNTLIFFFIYKIVFLSILSILCQGCSSISTTLYPTFLLTNFKIRIINLSNSLILSITKISTFFSRHITLFDNSFRKHSLLTNVHKNNLVIYKDTIWNCLYLHLFPLGALLVGLKNIKQQAKM